MGTTPIVPSSLTHSVQITLRDGSTATHTAKFARRITAAEDPVLIGQAAAILVVEAVCCQGQTDEITSRRNFVEDITGYSTDEIQAEILDHVTWLASHHANIHKAKDFVDGLVSTP